MEDSSRPCNDLVQGRRGGSDDPGQVDGGAIWELRESAAIAAVVSAVTPILSAVLPAVDTVRHHRGGPDDSRGPGHGGTYDAPPGHACWSQWHIKLLP
jgi:hypothetical protein